MSAQPTTHPASAPPAKNIEEQFRRLAAIWQAETSHLSSATRMAEHPAYREIISMGNAVVPLLLRELSQQPDHWFSALKAITGANPVSQSDRGQLDRMAAAWLQWGKTNGYQW
jgi:hypothetical protein